MNQVFDYPFVIRESLLDTFGHVNNAAYLQLFEEARWEFVTRRGYGLKKIQETQQGPVVLEVDLKFLRELRLRDQVIIRSQMQSYEGKIGIIDQSILGADGKVHAEAKFKLSFFDLKARKLILPSPEWLHAIGVSLVP
jgi:acyl-CoA thioester hydrolase